MTARPLLAALLAVGSTLVAAPRAPADFAPRFLAALDGPVAMASEPAGSLLVATRDGRIWRWTGSELEAEPVLDLSALTAEPVGERGLAAIVVDPGDPTRLYVSWVDLDGNLRVARWQLGGAGEPTVILVVERNPAVVIHFAGWLGFDAAGLLWITTGDGAPQGDPAAQARDPFLLHGKLLRLDPSTDAFPFDPLRHYAIPAGNPFADGVEGAPEVWALGLRNPWRAAFDPPTGDLWLGDVGWNAREEIDRIPGGTTPPRHFGWNCLEGTAPSGAAGCGGLGAFAPPVLEYVHLNAPCDAVIGGLVYRGPATALIGDYVFGDYCRGALWAARQDGAAWPVRTLPATLPWLTAFGSDTGGALYALTAPPGGGGALWELEPTLVFRDGFESGDALGWTASVP